MKPFDEAHNYYSKCVDKNKEPLRSPRMELIIAGILVAAAAAAAAKARTPVLRPVPVKKR